MDSELGEITKESSTDKKYNADNLFPHGRGHHLEEMLFDDSKHVFKPETLNVAL